MGAALPYTPVGDLIGFTPLPLSFLLLLAGMVATYLTLVELAKARFFRPVTGAARLAKTPSRHRRRIVRLLPRWVHAPTRR